MLLDPTAPSFPAGGGGLLDNQVEQWDYIVFLNLNYRAILVN